MTTAPKHCLLPTGHEGACEFEEDRDRDHDPLTPQEAYVLGILDGISAYSWMKDGKTFVGTTGKGLADALEDAKNGVYPPQRNMENVV